MVEHGRQGTPCDVLRMIFCALCDAAATSAIADPWKPLDTKVEKGHLIPPGHNDIHTGNHKKTIKTTAQNIGSLDISRPFELDR